MFSSHVTYVESCIREDETAFSACSIFADQKSVPVDEVVEDLAALIVARINYRRKKDLRVIEQIALGIASVTQATVNAERERFRVKYGLSYHQSERLSDSIVPNYLASLKNPREVVWETLKPILLALIKEWMRQLLGRFNITLPSIPALTW